MFFRFQDFDGPSDLFSIYSPLDLVVLLFALEWWTLPDVLLAFVAFAFVVAVASPVSATYFDPISYPVASPLSVVAVTDIVATSGTVASNLYEFVMKFPIVPVAASH